MHPSMEDKHVTDSEDFSQDFGDADDELSLCNLPIHGYEFEDASPYASRRASTSSDQELFEFCGGLGSELSRNDTVVFCGKIIDQAEGDEVNEYQKRDYLCVKAASFHKAPGYQFNGEDRELRSVSRNRPSSLRFSRSRVQKVNITGITSMSAQSRRRMFMFGPVKFKPEMDVSAIRRSQGRLPPMQIPPLPEGSEMVKSNGGGRGNSGGEGRLLRPLWCRSHLATALAKSFGCISSSMV